MTHWTELRVLCGVILIGVPSISFVSACSFLKCDNDRVFRRYLEPLSIRLPGTGRATASCRDFPTMNGLGGSFFPSVASRTRNIRSPSLESIHSGIVLVLAPRGGRSLSGGCGPDIPSAHSLTF